LLLSEAKVFYNYATGLSYSYNATSKELISYNNVLVAKQKAAFIQQKGLDGVI
jgi:GH18 family chitinase